MLGYYTTKSVKDVAKSQSVRKTSQNGIGSAYAKSLAFETATHATG